MMINRIGTSRRITTMTAAIALTLLMLLHAWPALAGPAITSLTTTTVNVGTPTSMQVYGANFCPGVRVQVYQPGVGYVGSSFAATYNSAIALTPVLITFTGAAGNYYIGAVDDLGNCGGTQANPTTSITLRPVITSLSPSFVLVGSSTFTLTINGQGFGPGSVMKWNSTVLPATYVSATQLTAQIPSSYLTSTAYTTIYASDPSGTVFSNPSFSFQVQNPVPTISSIITLSGTGIPVTTVRVFGSNFASSVSASAFGYSLGYFITTSNNGTQFDASFTASNQMVNGTSTIAVTNGGPGGGTVEAGYIYNSSFGLSSISPKVTTAGTGFTLTATGMNFPSNATIRWNGADLSTTYVSSTQLTASISSSLIGAAGTDSITVYNPNTSSASNALTLTINNPTPVITSVSPTTSPVGGAFNFYVYGTGFSSGSSVNVGTSVYTAINSYSPTQLYATYGSWSGGDADLLKTPATLSITVVNNNNGGTSNAATIQIVNPVPTLSSLSPTTPPMDSGFILTLTGSSFDTDSVVLWNGSSRPTNFSSSTQLFASIPLSDVQNGGTATITVYNPGPGGGTSGGKSLTLSYPVPTLSSGSPSTLPMGSSTSTLTLTGDHFFNVSTVKWNSTALTPTYIDVTHLSVSVPSSQLTSPGTAAITVTNPTPGGGTSAAFTYVIEPVLQVGALTQSGWNVTSTVTWPSSSSISNQSVNCGTATSQVIQGASATCVYSQAGTYTISGKSTVGTVTNVSTPTQSITVPLLAPAAAAFTTTVDGRPANPDATAYTLPVPLVVAVALTPPIAAGIVDPLDLSQSTVQVQLGTATPTRSFVSQVDAVDYTASSSLSQTGTYTITLMGKTTGGASLNASTTVALTLSNVDLQVGALAQDGWNVDVPISWPSGTNAILVDCGTSATQTFTGNSGTCVYSQGGTFSVVGTYHEPYHNTQVTTPTATVTIPILPPAAAALTTTVDGRPANPDATAYTLPVPLAVAVQLSRPTGVGIVDPLDRYQSTVQVQLGTATPTRSFVSQVDALDYTTGDSLSHAGTYTITFTGKTTGGASLNASTTVALTLSNVDLQVGALAQDGWNVDVPISWPSGTNAIQVDCGTSATQTFTGNSGTCVYSQGGTFSVVGTYHEPYHNTQVATPTATVTIPSIAPAAAVTSITLNGLQPAADGSVAPFHFPASLKAAITMTRGDGVGIVDPLDLANSHLIVTLSGKTPSSTYVTPGDDPLHASASNSSLTDPGNYTVQLDARTKGGTPITASLSLQVTLGAPVLVIGALSQDGFDVLVPVSWPADLGGITPIGIQCGTPNAQMFTDMSGTCRYTRAQTFSLTGTYQSPETGFPTLHIAPQSVTIPLKVPTGADMAFAVNTIPVSGSSITAYRLPAIVKSTIMLTFPEQIGIIDPLDVGLSRLNTGRTGSSTTAYRLTLGTDQTLATSLSSVDTPGDYTINLAGQTVHGNTVTATQTLTVTAANISLILGSLVQDGDNVAVSVTWPDGMNPVDVTCGTSSSLQTFTGPSGVCSYNRPGSFQITGTFINPEDNSRFVATPTTVTIPAVAPVNPQITLQINNQPVTDSASTYRMPSLLKAIITMQRPDGIGVLDQLDTQNSRVSIIPEGMAPTRYRPVVRNNPLLAVADGEVRRSGAHTITFEGKTLTGQALSTSTTLMVEIGKATLLADPPAQDGSAVTVWVKWPDNGPVGTVYCGFMGQTLTAPSGTCRYTRAGSYQIVGSFPDPARGSAVMTDPVPVIIPLLSPTQALLSIVSVNSTGVSSDATGSIPLYTTVQPQSYPVGVRLKVTFTRPDGVGVLDVIDRSHSSLTATAVADGAKPIPMAMSFGSAPSELTALANLRSFSPDPADATRWHYQFLFAGHSLGGTAYSTQADLVGAIGGTSPIALQVSRSTPSILYAPATYQYSLTGARSATLGEPFTATWIVTPNGQPPGQTVQNSRMMVTFEGPGTYQIQLIVRGPLSGSTTWFDTVTVPALPAVDAPTIVTRVPEQNRPPAAYRFTITTLPMADPRERIGVPTWTVEGTTSSTPSLVTTFTAAGPHQVGVSVPTSYGRTLEAQTTVTVNLNQPPVGTVDCTRSSYHKLTKKYALYCRATAADPDGRISKLGWVIPELQFTKLDTTVMVLEVDQPMAITVELHLTDNSGDETVVTVPIDMASLPVQ